MFCALNGATRTPCLASHRHSPATRTLLPASEEVPATRRAPFTGPSVAWPVPRGIHEGVLDDLTALAPSCAAATHPREADPVPPWRPASELTSPSAPLRDRIASVKAAPAGRGGRGRREREPRR